MSLYGRVSGKRRIIRRGLFVTQRELVAWNARAVAGTTFVSDGDQWTNSPGDWDRVVTNKTSFVADPTASAWVGLTSSYPTAIPNNGTSGAVPKKNESFNPEDIRDAAFYAMVLGSVHLPAADQTITATVRDNIIGDVETTITTIMESIYNDFSNATRFNPADAGSGFNPTWLINLYLNKIIMAYDYCQVANPDKWTDAHKTAFITWLWSIEPWVGDGGVDSLIKKRRNGEINTTTGVATASGAETRTSASSIWSGGPDELEVHHKWDNHLSPATLLLSMIAHLSELENERTGGTIDVLSVADIAKGKEYGLWSIKTELINEIIAQAAGNDGGNGSGNRMSAGQFYRAILDGDPIDGLKYAMENLARVMITADMMARNGDPSGYQLSYTTGVGGDDTGVDTSGSILTDTYFANAGPKELHRVAQGFLRYMIETGTDSHPWRYGTATGTTEADRIDSIEAGFSRSNDLEFIPVNIRFRDLLIQAIYDRSATGAPAHPASPRQGTHFVEGGPGGMFAGVCFQWAYL